MERLAEKLEPKNRIRKKFYGGIICMSAGEKSSTHVGFLYNLAHQ